MRSIYGSGARTGLLTTGVLRKKEKIGERSGARTAGWGGVRCMFTSGSIGTIPNLLSHVPIQQAGDLNSELALYVMPEPLDLKVRRWHGVTVHTFTRPAGESIVRVPYMRLLLSRTHTPKQVEMRLNGGKPKQFLLRSTALSVIPRNATTQAITKENSLIHIFHEPEIYRQAAAEIGSSRSIDFDFMPDLSDPKVIDLAHMLANEVDGGGFGERMLVEGLSYTIAVRISRLAAGIRPPRPGALAPERLARVVDFISVHLGDSDLSLHDLAAVVCLSTYQFGRAFKYATGETPHQFVLKQRIDLAKLLLRERRQSLSEIACSAGFADQAHFSNRFRQFVGVTPRQYRLAA
jgi:AraC family transcriptional regulator